MKNSVPTVLSRIICTFTLFATLSEGQANDGINRITAAEAYIDNHQLTTNLDVDSVLAHGFASISDNIDLSHLEGTHTLYIRLQDDDGLWSHPIGQIFNASIDGQALGKGHRNILTQAEYFYDEDPGAGNGTALNTPTDGLFDQSYEQLITGATVQGLSSGAHTLYLRFQDANGSWSMALGQLFYIEENGYTGHNTLARAEFFYDQDPGVGNGTLFNAPVDGLFDQSYEKLTTGASLKGLTPGVHTLYLRFQDTSDLWSVAIGQVFYIGEGGNTGGNNSDEILAAEAYFDTDPGLGAGLPLVDMETGKLAPTGEIMQALVEVTPLSAGLHTLYTRYQGQSGSWSQPIGQPVYLSEQFLSSQAVGTPAIFSADSALDGGNFSSASFTDGTTGGLVEEVDFSVAVGAGYHSIEVRFTDGYGQKSHRDLPIKGTPSDLDWDGVINSKDAFPNDRTEWLDTDNDGIGNNADSDDDNDGIPDAWEIRYGLDPLDSADAQADADSDSYSNLEEYRAGTDLNDSTDFPVDNTVAAPIIKPELSTFHSRVAVTLHTNDNEAQIYYTTNGTTPNGNSTHYSGPFMVEKSSTIKAFAFSHGQASFLTTKDYTVEGKIPWKPAPGVSWQWQLQGTIDTSYNVSMYDIDLLETPQQTIDQLKADGRTVVCYFNAGAWEEWRNDANLFPDSVKGNVLDGFSQEKWLDIRDIDTLAPLMRTRLDLAVTKGCDAVEPDNIDGYENNSGFPLTAEDQIAYNIWLSNEANARGLSIGLKNDLAQIPVLEPFYDWALNERCFQQSECDALQPFIDANKAVFGVEYQGNMNTFCPDANTRQFSWLYKSIDLDAATDFCMDSTVGGVVSGLTGQNLALQNNGVETITINSNGSFSFTTSLAEGDAYAITVSRQPTQRNQTCTVANSSGSMLSTNVTNVQVSCVNTAFIGGDNDGNGEVNIQDIVSSINTILSGGAAVNGGDCNNDGKMNIQDIICAINRVLSQ